MTTSSERQAGAEIEVTPEKIRAATKAVAETLYDRMEDDPIHAEMVANDVIDSTLRIFGLVR